MRRFLKKAKGFTVIEMIVSISVGTIFLIALFMSLQVGDEQFRQDDVLMTIQESAREGLYRMVQEIRQSSPGRITINGAGTQIDFQIPNPATPVNTNMADAIEDFTVEWASADNVRYSLVGGQIIRTNLNTNTTFVIANDVTGINFVGSAANPNLVTITMSVQRANLNGRLIPTNPLQMTAHAEVRNVS